MQTVKECLMEKGVAKGLAIELDEIVLGLCTRMRRLHVESATAAQLLLELGRYRRLERMAPNNHLQTMRIALDMAQITLMFTDQLRILERFGFIKLNMQTCEYALTDFGRKFMDTVAGGQ